ncbi:MAG: DUF2079 domain-containing protein [Candidatus Njordarchaeales archaeon]
MSKILYRLLKAWLRIKSYLISKKIISDLIVLASIALYIIHFSKLVLLRFKTFDAYAWDLGLFNQAFMTTLKHGKLFYNTAELYISPTGSLFAMHLSPALFLLLPFYALKPCPETLLIIQTVLLALGAIPLYALAIERLKSRWAAVSVVIIYLLYPLLHGVNWYDFHPQAMIPLFLFTFLYFFEKEKLYLSVLFAILTLSVEELGASVLMTLLSLYTLWRYKKIEVSITKESPEEISQEQNEMKESMEEEVVSITLDLSDKRAHLSLLVLAISISWLFVARWLKGELFPINPAFIRDYKASDNWIILGVDDPTKIPLQVLLHPSKALEALRYDIFWKVLYILLIFGPLIFVPVRSGFVLVIIAFLAPFLLSNHSRYYLIGHQYPVYIIPLVFMAFLDGLPTSPKGIDRRTLACATLLSIFFFSIASPLGPTSAYYELSQEFKPPKMTTHVKLLTDVVNSIPNGSVLTQNNIFPHLSDRINVYVTPYFCISCPDAKKYIDYTRNLLKNVDYVLVDSKSDLFAPSLILDLIKREKEGNFGLYAYGDGIFIYKREYDGPITYLLPVHEIYDYEELILDNGKVISDPSAESSRVLCHSKYDPQGTFWFGPYISLPPGNYTVVFRLKVDELGAGHLITLDVATDIGATILARYDVNLSEFSSAETWKTFKLEFFLPKITEKIEFRGMDVSNLTGLYLDYVEVIKTG